jgi:hypothetical protein
MKKRLLNTAVALSVSLAMNAQGGAQPQFPNTCSGIGYAVLNPQTNTNSTLYSMDATGNLSSMGALTAPAVNALGMDGRLGKRYLWGISSTVAAPTITATLYRIGSDGSNENKGIIAPPPGGIYRAVIGLAADMNQATGDYYVPGVIVTGLFPTSYTFYIGKFNVDAATGTTVTPTYTAITITGGCTAAFNTFVTAAANYALGMGPEPSGLFQDLVLSPDKTKLYGFFGVENMLFTIDLLTNTATCTPAPAANAAYTGCTGATTCEMGGMFFDASGKLFAHQVDTGKFFEVNTTTGALTLLNSSLPVDMRGDAATCAPIDEIPLPVQLVSFSATAKACDALVKWTTAAEENNRYFEIETSADGNSFTTVTRIDGHGTTTQTLHYEKTISVNSGISYIRLKQVDIDGRFTYSQAVKLQTNCQQQWTKSLSIAPNRISGSATVNLNISTGEKASLQIGLFNTSGKNVQNWNKVVLPGANQRLPLQVNNLPAGMYLLTIGDEKGNKHTERMMVQ